MRPRVRITAPAIFRALAQCSATVRPDLANYRPAC
jgi:hypothetical protein